MSSFGDLPAVPVQTGRRTQVLESAIDTFARWGYRKTSMEDVARLARISRPGLYLYFSSKEALLRAAVEHALSRDVAAAEAVLADLETPLASRLLEAVDLWAGPYIGPLATDVDGLLERDAALLGDVPAVHRARFTAAIDDALRTAEEPSIARATRHGSGVHAVRDVLLALISGTKHQATTRADFRDRIAFGIGLLLH